MSHKFLRHHTLHNFPFVPGVSRAITSELSKNERQTVWSTPRTKRTCLLALLDIRNTVSPCLHFCCMNNRFHFYSTNKLECENRHFFFRKTGVYELIGFMNYWKFYSMGSTAFSYLCTVKNTRSSSKAEMVALSVDFSVLFSCHVIHKWMNLPTSPCPALC